MAIKTIRIKKKYSKINMTYKRQQEKEIDKYYAEKSSKHIIIIYYYLHIYIAHYLINNYSKRFT